MTKKKWTRRHVLGTGYPFFTQLNCLTTPVYYNAVALFVKPNWGNKGHKILKVKDKNGTFKVGTWQKCRLVLEEIS